MKFFISLPTKWDFFAAVVILVILTATISLGLFEFPEIADGREYYNPEANLINKGIITAKYFAKDNHNFRTIELTVNDSMDCYFVLIGKLDRIFFDYVQVNDSIVEFKTVHKVTIRRNEKDTTFHLD